MKALLECWNYLVNWQSDSQIKINGIRGHPVRKYKLEREASWTELLINVLICKAPYIEQKEVLMWLCYVIILQLTYPLDLEYSLTSFRMISAVLIEFEFSFIFPSLRWFLFDLATKYIVKICEIFNPLIFRNLFNILYQESMYTQHIL